MAPSRRDSDRANDQKAGHPDIVMIYALAKATRLFQAPYEAMSRFPSRSWPLQMALRQHISSR